MATVRCEGRDPPSAADGGWLLRALAAGTAVLGMAACFDGYPQQQEPLLSPYDMTQAQRLAQMNALGTQAERRWTYELRPGCVLRVDVDGPGGAALARDIPLLGQAVALSANRGEGGYQVELQSAEGGEASGALVIASDKWTDASWTQLLLRLLQKGCMDRAAAAAHPVQPAQPAP